MTSVICIICQDSEQTEWLALPCGHVFHQACLTTWLNQDASCPHCKFRVQLASNNSTLRIYFASEDDRPQRRNQRRNSDETDSAAASTEADQELRQLREMLHMESQERHAAWNQIQDYEKVVAKLRTDQNREAEQMQKFSRDFESFQLRVINSEEQINEVKRLAALEQRENQELINQLLQSNHSLEDTKTQLNQKLYTTEQQNRELRSQLDFQISQVTQLQTSVEDFKRKLDSEQRSRQMEAEQLINSVAENSRLTEQLEKLKSTYIALRNTANQEVNTLKAQIRELEARLRSANEGQARSELERTSYIDRLRAQERQICELQMRLQAQQPSQTAPTTAGATYLMEPPPEYDIAVTAQVEENFSDFPVLTLGESSQHQVQQPRLHQSPQAQSQLQSMRAMQRSEPNLRQAILDEEEQQYALYAPSSSRRTTDDETISVGGLSSKKLKSKGNTRKCRQM